MFVTTYYYYNYDDDDDYLDALSLADGRAEGGGVLRGVSLFSVIIIITYD
jgi:hypothetical protein